MDHGPNSLYHWTSQRQRLPAELGSHHGAGCGPKAFVTAWSHCGFLGANEKGGCAHTWTWSRFVASLKPLSSHSCIFSNVCCHRSKLSTVWNCPDAPATRRLSISRLTSLRPNPGWGPFFFSLFLPPLRQSKHHYLRLQRFSFAWRRFYCAENKWSLIVIIITSRLGRTLCLSHPSPKSRLDEKKWCSPIFEVHFCSSLPFRFFFLIICICTAWQSFHCCYFGQMDA